MNTRITDIIFDIDGTLIDEEKCLDAQASSVAWKFGESPENKCKVIELFFSVNSEAALLESSGKIGFKNNLEWYMKELVKRFGLFATEEELQKLVSDWKQAYVDCNINPSLYSDVIPTLTRLKESGYRLHIASGKSLENRKQLLEKLGIISYFEKIFAAETVGYQKQDEKFWDFVHANLSVNAAHVFVVGNQKNDDVIHPLQLGYKTALIERGAKYVKDVVHNSIVPSYKMNSLSEVVSIVTSKPLKVCFALQNIGVGTHMDYVVEMAKAIRENDSFAVTLLIEKPSTNPSEKEDWIITQKFSQPLFRIIENFSIILKQRLNGTKLFYVHYSFVSAISAGLITRVLGGKVLYWNAGMPWLYKRSMFVELYQKFAFKCIDFLVTGAPALISGYASFYGLKEKQIKVIPNWIDLKSLYSVADKNLAREQLSLPKDVPILLFTHKLAKRKGAHFLVPIMKKLTNQDCHLVVAGDGGEMSNLRAEITKHNLEERVHLLGWTNRETVKKLYRAADIFILPSEEEGSPHSLIEAMAYGLPFVAFDVGGVSDTISPETKKYTCAYEDIETFAHNIDILIQDKEEYKKVVSINNNWIQQFDKKLAVERFVKLFQSIST